MALYTGQPYRQWPVSIGPLDLSLLPSSWISSDVKDEIEHWVSEAKRREDLVYFSIFLDQEQADLSSLDKIFYDELLRLYPRIDEGEGWHGAEVAYDRYPSIRPE